ncbi:hypothetical protein EK21DRAFT_85963 [Setomelanomma holmii]|uniref:Uncharacterized protein n=1 Tax=Setomelanomma holmii TaxID=210430 RepID=A0A9P4HF95_9PLEO|nr:hypothetical protein EK21DRAFT_85963 [Setomelanomma holmii]
MATLAAHDQENAVRNISIGPSGKPINAGAKAFGAKTPGNKAPKTPFKVPLNDENVFKTGRGDGKGKGNLQLTSKKGGDENAFVTPAGPRMRAPLGMKTTNAKSNAFQTPAPLSSAAKTQKVSPRLRRPKVKVHQPEPDAESEDDVPEVEYMPPKEVPLPDDMDDYLPKDWTFPKINDKDMVRGIWEAYHNPIEDDGRPKQLRVFEEKLDKDKKKANEEFEKVFEAQMAEEEAEIRRHLGIEEPKKEAPKPTAAPKRTTTSVSTIRARSAAQALSPATKPSYAVPTAAAKSRLPSGLVTSKKMAKPPVELSTSRRAAANAASLSTIGYAQGRLGRAAPMARKPLSNVTKPAPFSATTRRPAATSTAQTRTAPGTLRSRSAFSRSSSTATDSTLVGPAEEDVPFRTAEDEERDLQLLLLSRQEEDDDDAWSNSFNSQLLGDPVDEELEDFQLQLPEGF